MFKKLILAAVLITLLSGFTYAQNVLPDDVYTHLTEQCEKRDIPVSLVMAVIDVESDFDPEAVSGDNYGLMQINKVNHAWLREDFGRELDFLDPYDNLDAGIYVLAGYYHKYELHRALAAYNGGDGYARRLWKKGYESTRYTREVVGLMEEYEGSD